MRKRPLACIACVFLAGLAYQRYETGWFFALLGLLVFREIWLGAKHKRVIKAAGRSVILLSAFLLGVSHMQREVDFRQAYMSKIEDGCEVTVWGELIKTEATDWGIRGILSDCYIHLGEDSLPCNDIMVYLSSNHYQMGQIHKITGKVNIFSEARNQGNFDLQEYYYSQKIDFAVYEECCQVLSQNSFLGKAQLLSFRKKVGEVYKNNLKEKAAGFYQAMILGDKTNLDEGLKDLFFLGGLSHILAISGLHVSIIGRSVYERLRRWGIGFLPSGVLGGCLLIAYCMMVGNGMSTVRAVGMMLIFFLSQWVGRSYDMLNALGAMVLFLLWENPFLIEYSGFWFSVMALVGVGFVGKELSDCVKRGKGGWMSLGITLTTLPITALYYYEIPLYSPLVNFVALPLLTPVFCLAIIGGVLGLWVPIVAYWLLRPCEWLLSFYEWLCNTVSNLPGSSIICGEPSKIVVIMYYIILFAGVLFLHVLHEKVCVEQKGKTDKEGVRQNKYGWKVASLLSMFCFLFILFPKDKPIEITFLDVGQGDGVYMSGGDGSTYFIDGGSTSVEGVGEYRILPFLKSKGVAAIDYWFVSHCDTDHISGLLEILEKGYEIRYLVVAQQCPKDDMYETLISAAQKAEVEVLHMDAGDRICSDNIEITCLAPSTTQVIDEDRNENSLVLQVEWKTAEKEQSFKALFAGDISTEMEEMLCEKDVLENVDLFKANHHGSNYSNGALILDTISSEYIIVSCGENNLYGHPGEKAVERMEASEAEIFYTMDGGQITIELDKKGVVRTRVFLIQ